MKALRISVQYGRMWVAETSDGKRGQGATMESALEDLIPHSSGEAAPTFGSLSSVFDGIRDSGGDGQIAQGRASA
jgi:hypothetical protein